MTVGRVRRRVSVAESFVVVDEEARGRLTLRVIASKSLTQQAAHQPSVAAFHKSFGAQRYSYHRPGLYIRLAAGFPRKTGLDCSGFPRKTGRLDYCLTSFLSWLTKAFDPASPS